MSVNESRKTNADGKRGKPLYALFAVSLIAAFVVAILPMGSAFAAPVGPGGSDSKEDGWESKIRNLRSEMAISSNLQTQPGQSCLTAADARYRDQYIATLRAAQTLMVNPDAFFSNNGNNNNNNDNGNGNGNGSILNGSGAGGYYANNPEKLMAAYLHRMRQLREKMALSRDNNKNWNGGNSQNVCLNLVTNTDTGTGTGTGTGAATPAPTAAP